MLMKTNQEPQLQLTLYTHGGGATLFSPPPPPIISQQGNKPNSQQSIMAVNSAGVVRLFYPINTTHHFLQLSNSFCYEERAKRLKVTEEDKTSTSVGASLTNTNHQLVQDDVTVLPLIKTKLKSLPKPKPIPIEYGAPSFFDSSTSPETINLMLVSELNKIKASLVSSLKKIDESFARDVVTRIEYNCNDECEKDPFVVKKELEVSDVGSLCRIALKKDSVESYILPFCGPNQKAVVQSVDGIRITIYDKDTRSYHKLTLKRWSSNKIYILNNNWMKEFVNRRSLMVGDTIGLYWDSFYSHFCFSVLKRSG